MVKLGKCHIRVDLKVAHEVIALVAEHSVLKDNIHRLNIFS